MLCLAHNPQVFHKCLFNESTNFINLHIDIWIAWTRWFLLSFSTLKFSDSLITNPAYFFTKIIAWDTNFLQGGSLVSIWGSNTMFVDKKENISIKRRCQEKIIYKKEQSGNSRVKVYKIWSVKPLGGLTVE